MNWLGVAIGRMMRAGWENRWLFGVPIATCVLFATLYAVRLPDQYTATALLEIKNLSVDGGSDLPTERNRSVQSIAETARDRLLSQTPVSSICGLLFPESDKGRTELIEDARARIEYERLTDYSLKVSLTDRYPERAKLALERLLESFFEEERREPLHTAERNFKFYEEQMTDAKTRRAESYEALDKFRLDNQATLPDQQTSITMELQQYTASLTAEQGAHRAASTRLDKLRRDIADYRKPKTTFVQRKKSVQEEMAADALAKARRHVQDAEKRFNDIAARRTPTDTLYRQAQTNLQSAESRERELATALRQATESADRAWQADSRAFIERELRDLEGLKRQAEGAMNSADDRIQAIKASMADAQSRMRRIPATREALSKVERTVEEWEKRHDEARREAEHHAKLARYYRDSPPSEVTRFRIAQAAVLPYKPSGPSRARWILSGLLIGGLLGYGLLLLRRRFLVVSAVTVSDLEALLPGAMVVTVPVLGPGERGPSAFSVREVLFGIWTLGCILLTVLAYAAYKGWLVAPQWLTGTIGGAGPS